MTQEEKAKAYDEAYNVAKNIHRFSSDIAEIKRMEEIFPELEESEDEKWIPKEIANYLKEKGDFRSCWITWLEKQGEHRQDTNYPKFDFNDVLSLQCCMETVKKVQEDKDLYEKLKDLHGRIYDAYHFEKQGEQKPINEDAEKEKIEYVSGQFLYCKGSFNEFKEGESYWLEYIGNDTYVGRSDNILNKKFRITPRQLYTWLDTRHFEHSKQGEQETADNVKPKFHEGEWITNGDYTWKIVEVKPLDYILQSQDGNTVDDTISHVDEQFHSFTIEDAKNGDILSYQNGEWIFIFEKEGMEPITFRYHSLLSKYDIVFNSYCETTLTECIKPATKEQRDTLLKAMTDAGYTFDFEQKELKKIEQKPAWSEYDEQMLEAVLYDGENALGERHKEWLKGLKYRVQPQPKWSEEDEKRINEIIDYMLPMPIFFESTTGESGKEYTQAFITQATNWLKSLKDRYTWKPSELQLECLDDAIKSYLTKGFRPVILMELLEELKKRYLNYE